MTLAADGNVAAMLSDFGGDPKGQRTWPSSWGSNQSLTQKIGWQAHSPVG